MRLKEPYPVDKDDCLGYIEQDSTLGLLAHLQGICHDDIL